MPSSTSRTSSCARRFANAWRSSNAASSWRCVSGIRDEALLDRLIALDISAETLAALELVPLVFVAWADGQVQAAERDVIIALAKAGGVEPDDGRFPILEHWLKKRPGREMLDAWKQYVQDLRRQLDSQQAEGLRHELLNRVQNVAQRGGWFPGIRRQNVSGRARYAC